MTGSDTTWRRLALFAGVAALLMLPSFLWGPSDSDSGKYNYTWISQIGDELTRGHLYPRWLPDSFEGLGSPTFYFYPPLAHWIGRALHAIGIPVLTAINIAAWLGLLILVGVLLLALLAFPRAYKTRDGVLAFRSFR